MILPGSNDEKAPPPPYSLEDEAENPLAVITDSPPPPPPPKPDEPSSSPIAVPPKPSTRTSNTARPSLGSNNSGIILVSPWPSTPSTAAAVPPTPIRRPKTASGSASTNVRSTSDSSTPKSPVSGQSFPQIDIEVTSSSPVDTLPPPHAGFMRSASASTSDLNSAYKRSRNSPSVSPSPKFVSPVAAAANPQQASRKSWHFTIGNSTSSKSNLPLADDAKETVHAMVRDLIRPTRQRPKSQDGLVMPSPHRVLKGCREACAPYSLKLWEIIQEKYIEGHTPLYWSVVSQTTKEDYQLILTLLSFSSPLTKETISDLRQACLVRADQTMFEFLRSRPEWRAVFVEHNTKEDLLFGSSHRQLVLDTVHVSYNPEVEAQFAVDIELRSFQRRMRVIGRVEIEFIAKGRMWNIAFCAVPEKTSTLASAPTWIINLFLLETSLPTYVDSLLIVSPASNHGEKIAFPLSIPGELVSATTAKLQKAQKKEISLVVTESDKETYEVTDAGKAVGKKGKKAEGSTLRALRDAGSRYVDAKNDVLKLRWEVSTTKPEEGSSCIIC